MIKLNPTMSEVKTDGVKGKAISSSPYPDVKKTV